MQPFHALWGKHYTPKNQAKWSISILPIWRRVPPEKAMYLWSKKQILSPETCRTADTSACADALLQWFSVCAKIGSPTKIHIFLDAIILDMKRSLDANHHFTTARCPWANATVGWLMRGILWCTRLLLSEWRLQSYYWCRVPPIYQIILNQGPSPKMRNDCSGSEVTKRSHCGTVRSPYRLFAPRSSPTSARSH